VTEAVDRHGRALVLDAHSFPSSPFPFEDPSLARPDVCLGFEAPHVPGELVAALGARCRDRGLSVAHNEPFAGSYVPLSRYGRDARVGSVMVELNRRLYCDEATGERSAGFAATAGLVSDLVALAADAAREGW
jgi:N-formylglutamate amidohydrolase